MYKLRVVYSKAKEAIYLSHLDMISLFEKTFRRASIQVEYTKGFSPKPEIIFAHPLSVGVESRGEVFEVILKEKLDTSYITKELNKYLPECIIVLSAKYIDINEKNIMAKVYQAIYTISFIYDEYNYEKNELDVLKSYIKNKMTEYLTQDFLLVEKKLKKDRIDIKPMIKSYKFLINSNLEVAVDTGSKSNLNPEYIMIGFNEYIGREIKYSIRREVILFE